MSSEPDLIELIRSRGYWRVIIRPTDFQARRVARSSLDDALRRSRVSLRGWDFPHISQRAEIERYDSYIQHTTDWEHYLELWRLYRSGQFIYLGGIDEDWRDRSSLWKGEYNPEARRIGFISTIYQFTEAFEFAARLALTEVGGMDTEVSIGLHGLRNRTIYMDDRRRTPLYKRPSLREDKWEGTWVGSTNELVGQRSKLAIDYIQDLFDLFALTVQREEIEYHQDRLLEGNA